MTSIVYRTMNSSEEHLVCDLVSRVFNEFVAVDYEEEGIKEFFRFANPSALKKRTESGGFVLVACRTDAIVGMLEFLPPDAIAMLFVAVRHQGFAKALLARTTVKARQRNPHLSKLIVHSSPYAESIYTKMGFSKTADTRTENGITYTPMELSLKDHSPLPGM